MLYLVHNLCSMKPRVLVTRRVPQAGLSLLDAFDVEVHDATTPMPREQLLRSVHDKSAILSMLTDRIDAEVMDAAPNLRIIGNMAVGVDNIEVAEATRRGIAVVNTPDVLTDATADLAFALLLAVARRVAEGDRIMRARQYMGWDATFMLGHAVADRTLAIIGMGRIGRAVAERASGFRMPVLYLQRPVSAPLASPPGARWEAVESLDELLSRADFLSLNAPLTPQTHHMIGAAQLRRMKPTACLVNTARGGLIDETALVTALREGWIAGAALDVFEHEPNIRADLLACENCLVTPHIGSATIQTRNEMARLAANGIRLWLLEQPVSNLVNRELAVAAVDGASQTPGSRAI